MTRTVADQPPVPAFPSADLDACAIAGHNVAGGSPSAGAGDDLNAYVAVIVATAPPLTDGQVQRLAAVFRTH